jgi:hypothetical protein
MGSNISVDNHWGNSLFKHPTVTQAKAKHLGHLNAGTQTVLQNSYSRFERVAYQPVEGGRCPAFMPSSQGNQRITVIAQIPRRCNNLG